MATIPTYTLRPGRQQLEVHVVHRDGGRATVRGRLDQGHRLRIEITDAEAWAEPAAG